MDTHLTPINEAVVREREDAMRVAHERAATTIRAGIDTADTLDSTAHASTEARSARGGGDLLVLTLFSVLAAGFVSLVVTSLQL